MTKLILVLVAGFTAAVLVLPLGTAAARGGSGCDYVGAPEGPIVDLRPLREVVIYHGINGTTDDDVNVIGVCVDDLRLIGIDGGVIECGAAGPSGTPDADDDEILDAAPIRDPYCVADGHNTNPKPLDGYVGLSSYEDEEDSDSGSSPDRNCNGNSDGNGTASVANDGGANGGSCFGEKTTNTGIPTDDFDAQTTNDPTIEVGHPTPICGDAPDNQWEESSLDGCSRP